MIIGKEDNMEDTYKAEVESRFKKRIDAYYLNIKNLEETANKLEPVHDDLILIEKLDQRHIQSAFTAVMQSDVRHQIRISEMGRVISISKVNTPDEEVMAMRERIKIGDIVRFNGEAAYCLNIWGAENIWLISCRSILFIDHKINFNAEVERVTKKTIEYEVNAEIYNSMRNKQAAQENLKLLNKKAQIL